MLICKFAQNVENKIKNCEKLQWKKILHCTKHYKLTNPAEIECDELNRFEHDFICVPSNILNIFYSLLNIILILTYFRI